jgi:hypothetical protein
MHEELQIFGNISSKSSLVNQLEMPSPGVKSQEGPAAVQTPSLSVGDKVGNGVETTAVVGVDAVADSPPEQPAAFQIDSALQ